VDHRQPAQLSDSIREALRYRVSQTTWAVITAETGIPYSCLYAFLGGGGMRSDNLDKLARYSGAMEDGVVRLWDENLGWWNKENLG
jgi:hypothetical protein